jgi:hypothetical protein
LLALGILDNWLGDKGECYAVKSREASTLLRLKRVKVGAIWGEDLKTWGKATELRRLSGYENAMVSTLVSVE